MNAKIIEKRYERKYIFQNLDLETIIISLQNSEFFFRSHYPEREVNSIYFDQEFNSLIENLEGISNREKLRLRWYGNNSKIKSFYIEKKLKENFLSKKKRRKINLDKEINLFNEKDRNFFLFQKIDLKYDPIIFINYSRLYFISDICPIRATIDYNLSSIEFMGKNLKNEKKVFQNIILEFKYDLDFDENFRNKINKLNLRFSKNSKYVNSIIEYPDFYSL
jgi:hypothetical protein